MLSLPADLLSRSPDGIIWYASSDGPIPAMVERCSGVPTTSHSGACASAMEAVTGAGLPCM